MLKEIKPLLSRSATIEIIRVSDFETFQSEDDRISNHSNSNQSDYMSMQSSQKYVGQKQRSFSSSSLNEGNSEYSNR